MPAILPLGRGNSVHGCHLELSHNIKLCHTVTLGLYFCVVLFCFCFCLSCLFVCMVFFVVVFYFSLVLSLKQQSTAIFT